MNISTVSLSLDTDGNPVLRPGVILASSNVNIRDNTEEMLLETFKYKVEKILPGVQLNNINERGLEALHVNYIIKNDKSASIFNDQPKKSFRDAMMIFCYRGIWASFNYDSSEKHVREALNGWKAEVIRHAKDIDINVVVAGSSICTMKDVMNAMKTLPEPAEYLLVFGEEATKNIYKEFELDVEEWRSILFGLDGKAISFDETINKQDMQHLKDKKQCTTCGLDQGSSHCKNCYGNYQCEQCRTTALKKTEDCNEKCSVCQMHIPRFSHTIQRFVLYQDDKDTTLNDDRLAQLNKLYGNIYIC